MTRNGCYGESFNLNDDEGNKYIDPALARADPDHPDPQPKGGYWIDIHVNADNTDWCAIARPAVWGVDYPGIYRDDDTFQRNFIIGSDGVIYWNAEKNSTEFTRVLGSS